MQGDFSFDERVARRYNAQRAHPPEVSQQIGAAIAELAVKGNVLEIGVGTGRIANPVAAAGCRVIGIDISLNMLNEVGENLRLLQGDMHRLPFPDNFFDAVLAVHVLHLSRDWQQVIREIARVLRPDGVLIQGDDWIDPQSAVGMLRNELRAQVMRAAPGMRPPAAGVSKAELLAELGGTQTEERIAAEWVKYVSPAERLEEIENRLDAESWALPADLFDEMYQQLRDFAANTWDDIDAKQPVTRRFVLKVTRGTW